LEENVFSIEYILKNGLDKSAYGFIYITKDETNKIKYIGQRKFYRNWQDYLGSGTYLKRAIKKHGKENFSRKIIAIAYTRDELNLLEIEFIKYNNAVKSKEYYNINQGGDSGNAGVPFSIEHKKKISDSKKGKNNPNYGKKMSEKNRKKLIEFNTGRIQTEATKQKLRDNRTGKIAKKETKKKMSESRKKDKNHFYGKHHTELTKQKLRDINKGKRASEKTKQKMSNSRKGENNPNYGKHISEDEKQRRNEKQIKLSIQQVIDIREKYTTGNYTYPKLAEEYLVNAKTIWRIIKLKGVYKNLHNTPSSCSSMLQNASIC